MKFYFKLSLFTIFSFLVFLNFLKFYVFKKSDTLVSNNLTYISSEVRTSYLYKKPSVSDLSKLTNNRLIEIERLTDPLHLSATCPKEIYLLVLVVSEPKNKFRRDAIRSTWAYSFDEDSSLTQKRFQNGEIYGTNQVIRVVFLIGLAKKRSDMIGFGETADTLLMKDVYEEARFTKDIVFGSSVENYRNLTMKTRLGLKWSYYDCSSVYTIKTDDDVFINPVPLVEWLKDKPTKNFYAGRVSYNSKVIRNVNDEKWFVSHKDYQPDTFPPYCVGAGYIVSSDVVGLLLEKSYGPPHWFINKRFKTCAPKRGSLFMINQKYH